MPAPPVPPVEVVPVVVELVAGEVVELDVVLVELEVDGWVVVDDVEVLVVEVVVEVVVWIVVVFWQSRCARAPTVLAPCSRLARRVGLTVPGRFVTELLNCAMARAAEAHCRLDTAEETASS